MHETQRIVITLKDGAKIPVVIAESPLILLEHAQGIVARKASQGKALVHGAENLKERTVISC